MLNNILPCTRGRNQTEHKVLASGVQTASEALANLNMTESARAKLRVDVGFRTVERCLSARQQLLRLT